jgi:hypothetical protein
MPDDKTGVTGDDIANIFRISDRTDDHRSAATKHAHKTIFWTPDKMQWIRDNCFCRRHTEAQIMIVRRYGVTMSAADSIIRRAREEE